MPVMEIFLWLMIAFSLFFFFNILLKLRTAASMFMSVFIASVFIFAIYRSFFAEIAIWFSIFAGIVYAFSRAMRDTRDDPGAIAK